MGTALLIAGCGQKVPGDLPKLYPTNITVTCDGKPLKNATVTMFLKDPSSGKANISLGTVTDDKGVAKIQANGMYPGAPVGKYLVCISKSAAVEGPTSKKTPPTDPNELAKYEQKVSDERKFVPGLEKNYSSPKTTPFEIDITEGKNYRDFEVKKASGAPDFTD